MKLMFWTAAVWFGLSCAGYADQFRIRETRSGNTSDLSYATVRISNARTNLFTGKTDKYGRITVNLPKGQYDATVTLGSERRTVRLIVDGDRKLKQVSAK